MKYAVYIFCLTISLVFAPVVVGHVQASAPLMEEGGMAAMTSSMSKQVEVSHAMKVQAECPDCQDCDDTSNKPMTMCDAECQIACTSGANFVSTLTHISGSPEQAHLSYVVVYLGVLNGRTPAHQLPPPRA